MGPIVHRSPVPRARAVRDVRRRRRRSTGCPCSATCARHDTRMTGTSVHHPAATLRRRPRRLGSRRRPAARSLADRGDRLSSPPRLVRRTSPACGRNRTVPRLIATPDDRSRRARVADAARAGSGGCSRSGTARRRPAGGGTARSSHDAAGARDGARASSMSGSLAADGSAVAGSRSALRCGRRPGRPRGGGRAARGPACAAGSRAASPRPARRRR